MPAIVKVKQAHKWLTTQLPASKITHPIEQTKAAAEANWRATSGKCRTESSLSIQHAT
jgi:hypothetical protein